MHAQLKTILKIRIVSYMDIVHTCRTQAHAHAQAHAHNTLRMVLDFELWLFYMLHSETVYV